MNRILIKTTLALLLILTFFVVLPLRAEEFRQWEPLDGVPLRTGYHIEWFRGAEGRDIGDYASEVGMAWTDCRWTDTQLGDRAVWFQVLGTDEEFKFEQKGIRVIDTKNRQEDVGIWPSRTDGAWFLAWEDFDADSSGDIYATKVDRDGNWLWDPDVIGEKGVPVCTSFGIIQE